MTNPVSLVAQIDDDGIHVPATVGVQVLTLAGEYLWSFDPHRDGREHDGRISVEWPKVLAPFLDGVGHFTVADPAGEQVLFEGLVTLGTGEGDIEVVDAQGHPVSVDKVGHLQRSFSATNETIREEILSGTTRVLDELHDVCGVDAYLNYGALLGAVRDGAMIAHDSDTDLCYVSKYTNPTDIIAESFRMERALLQRGWKVLRMSAGDIKVLLPLSDGRWCHIDIFGAFWVNDVFYQFGNRSGHLPKESLLPLGTVELHGHTFPAPRDPEAMMVFLYGENWRVPDPSFGYADPAAGVRRLNGWFRGFRSFMGPWAEFHQGIGIGADIARRTARSEFADWVHASLPAEAAIAEIGCGGGQDVLFYAQQGRSVIGYDYSRAGRRVTWALLGENGIDSWALAPKKGVDVGVQRVILGELRTTLLTGAELARDPRHLTARLTLGALEDHERRNLWVMARMALRGHGGSFFLEFSAELDLGLIDIPHPAPERLFRRLSPEMVRDEIEAAGGRVEHEEIVEGTDMTLQRDPALCRMRVTFPAPQAAATAAQATPTTSERTPS